MFMPPRDRGQSVTEAQAIRAEERADTQRSPVAIYSARAAAVTPGASLLLKAEAEFFTPHQLAALAQLGVADASVGDLAVFFHQAVRTGLDPFTRQIHMIGRRVFNNETKAWETRWTIQTGIGGYQVLASRAARRDGVTIEYEDTVWYDADGHEYPVWLAKTPPHAARVIVRKDGLRFPGVVLYSEVAALKDGQPMAEWKHQPAHLLEKTAEAFALRRAFPHDLSGIYTDEEMGVGDRVRERPRAQAVQQVTGPKAAGPGRDSGSVEDDEPVDGVVVDEPGDPDRSERPKGDRQRLMARLHSLCGELGIGDDRGVRMGVLAMLGRTDPDGLPLPLVSSSDLTDEQAERAVAALTAIRDAAKKSGEAPEVITGQLRTLAVAGGWEAEPGE